MKLSESNKEELISVGIKMGIPLAVIGTGIYLIRKLFKGSNADGTSSITAPSLKNTTINKSKLTISISDAGLFANTLYGAMLDFGTDEKTIYSVMDKINTKDDMLLVIKSFGMKQYLWGTRAGLLGQNYNLIGWLKFELSTSELAKIKPKFDKWNIPI
jgi:hypothetical protein